MAIHFTKSALLLILQFPLLLGCSDSQPVFLRLAYKVGDEQTLVTTTKTDVKDMIKLEHMVRTKFTVTAVNGDVIDFDVDVLEIRNDHEIGGESTHYNSKAAVSEMSDDEAEMHRENQEMLDSTLKLSINSRGEVLKPFSFSDGRKAPEPVEMGIVQLIFPKDTLAAGQEWTNERTVSLTSATVTTNLKVKYVTDEGISIALEGSSVNPLAQAIDPSAKSPMKGHYFLDKTTKRLKNARIELESAGGGVIVTEVKAE